MTLRTIGSIITEVMPYILDGTLGDRIDTERAERRPRLAAIDETYTENPDPREHTKP